MGPRRSVISRVLQAGRTSTSTYRLLTGLVLLLLAGLLWSARSDDGAAGPVALVLLALAVVQLALGARARWVPPAPSE